MSVKIEEFVAHLGWEVDASELEDFKNQAKDTAIFFAKIAAAITGATAALTAFTIATNKQTSIQTQLAKAYDISAESAENWGFMLGAVGLNTENVIRAAKDLNVRLGQAFSGIGDAKTMKDAVQALGLEFNSLKDQKPEEQFKSILQAAKDLDNQQVALAASQQLMGRQGAIVTGYLRDQEGTIEELLEAQGKFNLLTEENREQAMAFTALWDNTTAVLGSAKSAFAAVLGEALSPLLKEFLKWVKANRELIKLKIAEWAERIGRFLAGVFRVMRWGFFVLKDVVDAFGGLRNVLALLSGMLAGFALVKIVNLFMRFGPIIWKAVKAIQAMKLATAALAGKWLLVGGVIALAGLAINSLVRFFQGRDSLVGDLGGMVAEEMDDAMLAMGRFLGLSEEDAKIWKEEMQLLFSRLMWDIEKSLGGAWEAVSELWAQFISLDWGQVAELWGDAWRAFANWFKRLWSGIVDWFSDNVIGVIVFGVKNAIQKATSFLKKVPLIGRLFDSPENVNARTTPPPAASLQLPSLGVLQTVNQTRQLLNTANNVSKQTSPVVNATYNITQRPGESGADLSRRIQGGMREEFAKAIRDNDTGVEY
jgi:hypothetical protein